MSQTEKLPDDLITRAEAATVSSHDERTVDRWANEGRITRYKIGGRQWVRFSRREVEAMVAPVEVDPFEG